MAKHLEAFKPDEFFFVFFQVIFHGNSLDPAATDANRMVVMIVRAYLVAHPAVAELYLMNNVVFKQERDLTVYRGLVGLQLIFFKG